MGKKKYHAVVGEINKNKANFGEAAATLLLLKLRIRNKTHDYLVHKETALFVGMLVVIMVTQLYSSLPTVCHLI